LSIAISQRPGYNQAVRRPPTCLSRQCTCALLFLAAFFIAVQAKAADLSTIERDKINYLIASIEGLQDARFIRNGSSYDAGRAAAHLRLKLRSAGAEIRTADDFIRLCASVSSVTGKPYQIRFADGEVISSESYLRQKLAEFPREPHSVP
jgi:hypothetical protein